MKGSLKIDELSFGMVELAFKNIALKAPQHAARTMRRAAERVASKARMLAPEDTKHLVNSIRIEESRGARNRLEIRILVGGEGMIQIGGEMVSFDDYVALVHEHYSSVVRSHGKYVGEGTRRKEAMGIPVGEQFMTRAAAGEEQAIERAGRTAIAQVIQSEFR